MANKPTAAKMRTLDPKLAEVLDQLETPHDDGAG